MQKQKSFVTARNPGTCADVSAYFITTTYTGDVMVVPLTYLEQGRQAEIVWMALPPDLEQPLSNLGFREGARILCIRKNKKNSMAAYEIGPRLVALRPQAASGILVKLV